MSSPLEKGVVRTFSGSLMTPVIHVVLPEATHRRKLAKGCNARAQLARFSSFCSYFHQGMDQNAR